MFTRKQDRSSDKQSATVKGEQEKRADPPETSPLSPLELSTPLKGSSQMVPSVIGEDLTVEGNVISKGEVQLEGEIKGDVHCASLVIGDKALIEGGVVADDVIVRGKVVGSIRGHRVTLQSSSHVEGDIFHQSLAIEQGAYFEGKSRRSDDPMAEARSAKTTKTGFGTSDSSSNGKSGLKTGGDDNTSSSKSTHAAE